METGLTKANSGSHVPAPVAAKAWADESTARRALFREERAAFLALYLIFILIGELLFFLGGSSGDDTLVLLGVLVDVFLIVALLVQASFLATRDLALANFLAALTLAPLLRIVSVAAPIGPLTIIEWLAIVSVPLLLGVAALTRAQGLRAPDVFLAPGARRYFAIQVALAVSGFGIGYIEYLIIQPAPWITTPSLDQLILAGAVVFLATGVVEELVFRGILLADGIRMFGARPAILYVTFVYAILHVGSVSVAFLPFIFGIGLILGIAVAYTRSLWGAIAASGIANMTLYLILPFGF